MARALDRDREGTLALRGEACLAARLNLTALGEEPAQTGDILVINLVNTIGGEDVYPTTPTGATTTKPTTATATAKSATAATATALTAIIGTRWAVVTRPTLARSERRALLIHHRSFLLHG